MQQYGRNKKALIENTKEIIDNENLKILNSKIQGIYFSDGAWEYFNG